MKPQPGPEVLFCFNISAGNLEQWSQMLLQATKIRSQLLGKVPVASLNWKYKHNPIIISIRGPGPPSVGLQHEYKDLLGAKW